MALDLADGGIFGTRLQTEGVSPEEVDVSRADDLTQNISNALGVDTYSIGTDTEPTGSLINLFDGDTSTSLQWIKTTGAEGTTTLILDLGKVVRVHNTVINFRMDTNASGSDATFTTSYSRDGINYTTIGTTNITGVDDKTYDDYTTNKDYRYLKIVANLTESEIIYIHEIKLYR